MKSPNSIFGIVTLLFLIFSALSCNLFYGGGHVWECNGINPEGLVQSPNFDDTIITYADPIGNTLSFHVVDTFINNYDCPSGNIWRLNGTDTNMRCSFSIYAPLPQSNSTYYPISYEVIIDTDIANYNEGFMAVNFDINRLDTTTVSFMMYGKFKYDVIPSLTTPSQTYNHVYVCTYLDAVPGSSINPDKIYFHKGTGCIGFHDITNDKNWYFQP